MGDPGGKGVENETPVPEKHPSRSMQIDERMTTGIASGRGFILLQFGGRFLSKQ